MKAPELHPDATEELIDSAQFLKDAASAGLADRFLDEFFKVVERIGEYPESGFRISGSVRGARISDFRYDIVYRIERRRIYIIAVAHQSRNPGYWRGRI
jgi:plasmid stabilization system protein ParE